MDQQDSVGDGHAGGNGHAIDCAILPIAVLYLWAGRTSAR